MPAPLISGTTVGTQQSLGGVSFVSGTANAAPTGSVNDLFAKLRGMSWKGVGFPITDTDFDLRHDLVIHKFADRNGAYVENTGRAPVQVTATIPFFNYIFSAANENWPQGALYPLQWRQFLIASLEGTSGTLVHPELGELNCKLDLAKTSWSAKVRGGVLVHATWIESDDTSAQQAQLGTDLSNDSPIGQLIANADDLDENIATLAAAMSAQANPLPALTFSFTQLAGMLSGVIDVTTVLSKQFQGAADNVIFQANQIETHLDIAVATQQNWPAGSPMMWPFRQAAERSKAAAYALKQQPQPTTGNSVLKYTVPQDSTIAGVANDLKTDIASFTVLNAQYLADPVIPQGAVVQYYLQVA